jgi:hypothetical protein
VSVATPPSTLTSAEIVSPAEIEIGTLTELSGSSSYHAAYTAWPLRQSDSVPVCSSPPLPPESPPRPTQKAA